MTESEEPIRCSWCEREETEEEPLGEWVPEGEDQESSFFCSSACLLASL